MNREVMDRQMFRYGGGVPMQEGGVPPAPMPMPMPEIDPEQVEMNQAAEGAMQNGIDPAVLEGMLGQYSQQMTGLDSAEDYETVINGIRGDNLPMEARYAELSDLVGPEDAQQTPESVLALLQPVMMLAGADQEAEGVDQGIGGLAQDEMMAPIEGPMAEGIMSTVNMEPPPEEMMVAMGGTTPVNFNQGGAVQYMKDGGGASDPRNLQTAFDETKDIYQSLLGSQAGEYDEQKNMTKAQMLFDIAQGALAFATPGERRMSPAERLAQSFTPVLGNIGARVGELNKFKQAQAKEGRALDVAALGSAEKTLAAEKAAEAALAAAKAEAHATRLGGKPLTAKLTFLNDPERLALYGAGKLPSAEKNNFEALVVKQHEVKNVWDDQLGRFVLSSPRMTPELENALSLGNPDLLKQIKGGSSEERPVEEGETATPSLSDATTELFNEDGTVNMDSPVWETTQPNQFDPTVDYRKVVGASSFFPNIGKVLSEGTAELLSGDPSAAAQNLAKASKGLTGLANRLLLFSTQSEGRVLKFVQEYIEKETDAIRPGGLFLKTDADATAAFDQLSGKLQGAMQEAASILPEYNGNPGEFTQAQVTKTRQDMIELKVLLNEVTAFQKGFKFKSKQITPRREDRDQSTKRASDQIREMRGQNNGN